MFLVVFRLVCFLLFFVCVFCSILYRMKVVEITKRNETQQNQQQLSKKLVTCKDKFQQHLKLSQQLAKEIQQVKQELHNNNNEYARLKREIQQQLEEELETRTMNM